MSFDKRVARLSRGLRRHDGDGDGHDAPAPTLRDRMLAALPADRTAEATGPLLPRRRVFGVLAGAALAGLGMVAAPRLFVRFALAAEVRAAVARADTWHLSGWRMQGGKRLRWEVWGRRSPFFYREQVGNAVLFDDGVTRTQVLTAERPGHWSVGGPGGVLIRPSPGAVTLAPSDPRAGFLIGIGAETGDLRPVTPGGSNDGDTLALEGRTQYGGLTLIDETVRLTVDRASRLPVRYTVEWSESRPAGTPETGLDWSRRTALGRRTVAELRASYDVPLPPGIDRAPTAPPGYAVADMTRPATVPEAHGPGTARAGGLTVRGEVLGRDRAGNLHLRFRGWLGNEPINPSLIPLHLWVERSDGLQLGADDAGRPYVIVDDLGFFSTERPHLWLAPRTPLPPGSPRPKSITVELNVELSGYERMGRTGRAVPIVSAPMTLTLALPDQDVDDLGYDDPKQWGRQPTRRHKRFPTFREKIARARRHAYHIPLELRTGRRR